jgi:hypothetical protein
MMKNWFLALGLCVGMVGCQDNGDHIITEMTFITGSELVDCGQGFVPSPPRKNCFAANTPSNKQGVYLFEKEGQSGGISGFQFEVGFEYTLLVSEYKQKNPIPDGSCCVYTFIKIVDKKKAP